MPRVEVLSREGGAPLLGLTGVDSSLTLSSLLLSSAGFEGVAFLRPLLALEGVKSSFFSSFSISTSSVSLSSLAAARLRPPRPRLASGVAGAGLESRALLRTSSDSSDSDSDSFLMELRLLCRFSAGEPVLDPDREEEGVSGLAGAVLAGSALVRLALALPDLVEP